MDTAVPQGYLQVLLDRTLRRVTQTVAGIQLHQDDSVPVRDLYTVHIAFARGFHSVLTLCADFALFARLARQMLSLGEISPEDVEDFAKEYFNVVCGHIAAEMYRSTNISARFTVPGFCRGRYMPESRREQFVLRYVSDRSEAAHLIHYTSVLEEPEPHEL